MSLNSLDKLDSAVMAVRASPDTLERAVRWLEVDDLDHLALMPAVRPRCFCPPEALPTRRATASQSEHDESTLEPPAGGPSV